MLELAVFNSIKYSFNKKTWVSNRAKLKVCLRRRRIVARLESLQFKMAFKQGSAES